MKMKLIFSLILCGGVSIIADDVGSAENLLSVKNIPTKVLQYKAVIVPTVPTNAASSVVSGVAAVETNSLAVISALKTGPENWLFYRIAEIRALAVTDPDVAENMAADVVRTLRKMGAKL